MIGQSEFMVLWGQRWWRAVNEGLPEEVIFRLSSEHEVGEIQVNRAEGTVRDKDKGESWSQVGGLQCPVKELLILGLTGIHSMEVVMQSDLHWKITLVAEGREWVREGQEWRPGSQF